MTVEFKNGFMAGLTFLTLVILISAAACDVERNHAADIAMKMGHEDIARAIRMSW